MGYYRMSFETFNNLLLQLTLFFQSHCVNLIQPQVEIRKIVTIVINRLAHENSATHMANQFNVGTSTIRKYVDNSM
jgi:predicted AAA+ superfamily ATPase